MLRRTLGHETCSFLILALLCIVAARLNSIKFQHVNTKKDCTEDMYSKHRKHIISDAVADSKSDFGTYVPQAGAQ